MDIVFILGSIVNPNSIKRIEEFNDRGYNVKAYGFDRGQSVSNKPTATTIQTIGIFDNSLPYKKRISIYCKGIKSVLKETSKNSLYYVIGYDVAIIFRLLSKRKFIYEVPDLVYVDIKNKIVRNLCSRIDRYLIKHSFISAFRSEGFIKYLFGDNKPDNVMAITNRLNKNILNLEQVAKQEFDPNVLKIGFVGYIRYNAIYNFAKVLCTNFPQYEFHFFGTFSIDRDEKLFEQLKEYPNCKFHGAFNSPLDLPQIYSSIDLVLSTYDVESVNVLYAEPNKIYEAIYFRTPIIVSSGTFLAEKVNRLNIGFDVDAMDESSIIALVNKINNELLSDKKKSMNEIPMSEVVNVNDFLFEKLSYFRKAQN